MVLPKLCLIRDIYRSISELEMQFEAKYSLCFNEMMLLCSLTNGTLSSSEIADKLGLSNSNTSKVLKSVEKKQLVNRILGKEDKRQMYFSLSDLGKATIETVIKDKVEIPEILQKLVDLNR